jgi:hypothetical protein
LSGEHVCVRQIGKQNVITESNHLEGQDTDAVIIAASSPVGSSHAVVVMGRGLLHTYTVIHGFVMVGTAAVRENDIGQDRI